MNLAEAIAGFLERQPHPAPGAAAPLQLLAAHFPNLPLTELLPATLRQFLAVWYVEEAVRRSTPANQSDNFPDAQNLLAGLTDFFSWLDGNATMPQASDLAIARQSLAVVRSLQTTLPRAIAITRSLSDSLASRGGAFAFPEFLSSFEQGGQSAYDIGELTGESSAIEGYFEILRLDGAKVEARELISERLVWPILFPEETAALLDPGYLINLELVSFEGIWEIVNCGFAYPPDTEI
jgi:hypothetical protein